MWEICKCPGCRCKLTWSQNRSSLKLIRLSAFTYSPSTSSQCQSASCPISTSQSTCSIAAWCKSPSILMHLANLHSSSASVEHAQHRQGTGSKPAAKYTSQLVLRPCRRDFAWLCGECGICGHRLCVGRLCCSGRNICQGLAYRHGAG